MDDDNIYWHWQTELTLLDDESVLKLFEIQSDSTLSLRDEVKYGSTYGRDASNLSTDSLLHVLQRDAYEVYRAHFDLPEFSVGVRGASWEEWEDVPFIEGGSLWREVDLKRYELKDHLGNVRVIVSDLRHAKLDNGVPTDFTALIKHYSNYYPFGMEKPAMVWDKGGYRYGFNGKENDDEVSGVANNVDFGARMYDSRLGRWTALDPLMAKYPDLSPYNGMGNNPIIFVDVDGRDIVPDTDFMKSRVGQVYMSISNNKSILNSLNKYTVSLNLYLRLEDMKDDGKFVLNKKINSGGNIGWGGVTQSLNMNNSDSELLASNSVNENASDIYIVATIAHEVIHAEIGAKLKETFTQNQYSKIQGINQYCDDNTQDLECEHQYMAEKRRTDIIDVMKEYDLKMVYLIEVVVLM